MQTICHQAVVTALLVFNRMTFDLAITTKTTRDKETEIQNDL